jgi:Fe2+ transport system protein FeoA
MRGALAHIAKLESRRSTRPVIVVAVGIDEDYQVAIDRKLSELGLANDDNVEIIAVKTGVRDG